MNMNRSDRSGQLWCIKTGQKWIKVRRFDKSPSDKINLCEWNEGWNVVFGKTRSIVLLKTEYSWL